MKTRALKNYGSSVGVEAFDIDWTNKEEVRELGRLSADQCIVLVKDNISTKELFAAMLSWGDASQALIHEYVIQKKLSGRHWRKLLTNIGYISQDNIDLAGVSTVTYRKGDRGRPRGLFQNGELDWHSDQCATDDSQRIIGLQSISDSANSQTQFLCTHDAFESLSSDMKSMIKELIVKHKWVNNLMAPDLNEDQTMLLRYNMVPIDGMETHLYRETATGRPGIKFPSHTFDGFAGMTREGSDKIITDLKKAVYKDQFVFTQNWQDGEIVFMDQEITLHKRPTNIKDGDKRLMARCITYVNHLFPTAEYGRRADSVRYNGQVLTKNGFAKVVDQDRRDAFRYEELHAA